MVVAGVVVVASNTDEHYIFMAGLWLERAGEKMKSKFQQRRRLCMGKKNSAKKNKS